MKITLLNNNLETKIYMIQFKRFMSKESPNKICILFKSKQAFQSWNIRFDETIRSYDFIKNKDEPHAYMKVSESTIIVLMLYVDDILIIENKVGILSIVKTWLPKYFSMKNLGEAFYTLRI